MEYLLQESQTTRRQRDPAVPVLVAWNKVPQTTRCSGPWPSQGQRRRFAKLLTIQQAEAAGLPESPPAADAADGRRTGVRIRQFLTSRVQSKYAGVSPGCGSELLPERVFQGPLTDTRSKGKLRGRDQSKTMLDALDGVARQTAFPYRPPQLRYNGSAPGEATPR